MSYRTILCAVPITAKTNANQLTKNESFDLKCGYAIPFSRSI